MCEHMHIMDTWIDCDFLRKVASTLSVSSKISDQFVNFSVLVKCAWQPRLVILGNPTVNEHKIND